MYVKTRKFDNSLSLILPRTQVWYQTRFCNYLIIIFHFLSALKPAKSRTTHPELTSSRPSNTLGPMITYSGPGDRELSTENDEVLRKSDANQSQPNLDQHIPSQHLHNLPTLSADNLLLLRKRPRERAFSATPTKFGQTLNCVSRVDISATLRR